MTWCFWWLQLTKSPTFRICSLECYPRGSALTKKSTATRTPRSVSFCFLFIKMRFYRSRIESTGSWNPKSRKRKRRKKRRSIIIATTISRSCLLSRSLPSLTTAKVPLHETLHFLTVRSRRQEEKGQRRQKEEERREEEGSEREERREKEEGREKEAILVER